VRSLRAAAALLARATSVEALAPLAASLGFDAPAPLDAAGREALRLPAALTAAHVARGPGALRALVAAADTRSTPLRDVVAATAARLTTRAPHLLWLIAVVEEHAPGVALAACAPDPQRTRVAALVADRTRMVDSDADTLRALAAARSSSDALTHTRWLDLLGRASLTRRFFLALERSVLDLARAAAHDHPHPHAPADARRELALLHTSRLLFLSFLEAKGWLDGDRDFLARGFARCMEAGGHYHARVLRPLFFGTLNTRARDRAPAARAFGRIPFLNGGLFARTPLERRFHALTFPDEQLGALFADLLGRYRFTAREDRATWSEAAVDPEMLGKAFESLMAPPDRRASGAFYTPQALVARTTAAALAHALACPGASTADAAAALDGEPPPARARRALAERAARLRVLDPACGSGAFLVHALEQLAALATTLGDRRPPAAVRREVLARSIFGVDVNPIAVWLCELRLWLSVVIDSAEEDPRLVPPLPNLDHHVRVGDALAGGGFGAPPQPTVARSVARLRARYARAAGARKRTLARALDREERTRAIAALDWSLRAATERRRDALHAARARDLFDERHRPSAAQRAALAHARAQVRELRARRRALAGGGALPFAFASHFADVALSGGFDVVCGNPPWVRTHAIPPALRAALRRDFDVCRRATWTRGACGAAASAGFAGQVDLAAPFVERSLGLLRARGTLALLLPAKLWRSLAGGGLRRLLLTNAHVRAIEDWSDAPAAFDASVYPALLVATRVTAAPATLAASSAHGAARPPVAVTVHRSRGASRWDDCAATLGFDDTPESPWLLVPPDVRSAFRQLTSAGTPLAAGIAGRPLLGVKCGCNDAFVVELHPDDDPHRHPALAHVTAGDRAGLVERELLRPLLRGGSLRPWRVPAGHAYIVYTHDDDGRPLERLPPHAERWLAFRRRELEGRADARGRRPWWTLHRVAGAAFTLPRVVWRDVGRSPGACVLRAGCRAVALNSCYVVRCPRLRDAHALAALLNSPLAAAWLAVVAEPARGGYHRYLGWTVALLPLPADWSAAAPPLAELGARASAGRSVSDATLLAAALAAYGLTEAAVAPLVAWNAR